MNFLPVPAVFRHRPARCNLTETSLEGDLPNAYAVWTT